MARRSISLLIVMAGVLGIAPAAWADNLGAAGDISNPPGGFRGDTATAALLAPASGNGIGLVLPLGDSQYQCGELANYRAAYDLSWGGCLPSPGRPREPRVHHRSHLPAAGRGHADDDRAGGRRRRLLAVFP